MNLDNILPSNPAAFKYRSDFRTRRPSTPNFAFQPIAGKFMQFEEPLTALNYVRRDPTVDMKSRLQAEQNLTKMLSSTPGQNNLLLFNQEQV
jgi:hypothetical protein